MQHREGWHGMEKSTLPFLWSGTGDGCLHAAGGAVHMKPVAGRQQPVAIAMVSIN
jgi:hypothetical protein